MFRSLPLVLLVSWIVVPSAPAQTGLGAIPGTGPDAAEGATLDVVAVPPGGGDGRITERDARAFSAWCVWGFRELLAAEGMSLPLAPNAEALMLDFWVYVWVHVDASTRVTVSQADVLWPQHQQSWNAGDPATRQLLLQQFGAFFQDVWTGIEAPTVQYLTGQLPPAQYALLVDQALASRSGGGAGAPGGSGSSGFAGLPDGPGVVYDDTHVVNDGSGDIMYSVPY
ncbi:MAG TPA: hypothetical protein VKU85_13945 [bacterium]|nr:hypothetical protein [bacterium]